MNRGRDWGGNNIWAKTLSELTQGSESDGFGALESGKGCREKTCSIILYFLF